MNDHPDRLIDWTGERCVPWTDDVQVVYEHYHRYLLASRLVRGLRVLDLASGEGYGSAILATTAEEVVGVDIDDASVLHASRNYGLPSVTFRNGDMTAISELSLGEFGAVVCFEALEHVEDHEAVLEGIAGILAPEGLLIISMPDRDIYSGLQGQENPYHQHELNLPEFETLLLRWFPNIRILGQSVATGSVMFPRRPLNGWAKGEVIALERIDENWQEQAVPDPTYLIAVASRSKLPPIPSPTTLLDTRHEILHRADQRRSDRLHLLASEGFETQRRRLQRSVDDLLLERRRIETSLDLITRRHDRLFEELAAARATQAAALDSASAEEDFERSSLFAVASRYRSLVERYAPTGTLRRRIYSHAVKSLAGSHGRRGNVGPTQTQRFKFRSPEDSPDASIVIPVYDGWGITEKCLEALARDVCAATFEVIVVDDASSDETAAGLATIGGIKVVRLDRNKGFLNAANVGISAARGRYIVLLNNDTEVEAGWLDALLDVVEKDSTVGLVGAKLVYPDGRLQEAGGIIYSDGSGCNYGRGDNPSRAIYNFPRDVDYCSGACILFRRELIDRLGGLDTSFSPAYYEDTDLAFAVRKLGYRVVYQPKCVVVHHEGASNGTDLNTGVKRYQDVNREVFKAKWEDELRSRPAPGNVRLGSWRGEQPRILVADEKVPTPNQDSGSRRMFGLLKLLSRRNYRVSFLPGGRSLEEPYTSALLDLGIEVLDSQQDVPEFIRSVSSDLDLAILSRPNEAWPLVPQLAISSPRTRIIYDTVDLHYVRERRRAEIEGDPEVARFAENLRQMELTLTARADTTLVVTEVEKEILGAEVPKASIATLPNIHDDECLGAPFEVREGILFVGSFPHLPNRDAAHFLVEEILPLVWEKLPDLKCFLVGSNPTPDILALARDNVQVLGWVPDLRDVYNRVRVLVAPLRYGAGMKGKIGESLAHSVPVVTTSIGAEGMALEDGKTALIADDVEGLATAIVNAYWSKEIWTALSETGRQLVAERFSPFVVGETLDEILEDVLKR